MRVAIYLRVSTTDQTTDNQRRELEAVASRHNWSVVRKGRDARPGLDALMKGVSRRDFDMVLAWSVDRLGRSLTGLLELLTELHAKHVDLYLHQQGLDTSNPVRQGHVPDDRRICRVRALDDPGTSAGWHVQSGS
jgi:DNA invertase Pin-like site-specific DNA recombinase